MYNPFLNKESALEAIGTPEKSVHFVIDRVSEISHVHGLTNKLKDYAVIHGENLRQPFNADERIIKPIVYLQKRFRRLLLAIIDEHALPAVPKESFDNPNTDFSDCMTFFEAVYNVLEHGCMQEILTREKVIKNFLFSAGEGRGVILDEEERKRIIAEAERSYERDPDKEITLYSSVQADAYSSSRGIVWVVSQEYGGEEFVKEIEPVLTQWPPASFDLRYKNAAGRLRGNGLTRFISPNYKDQVSYQFLPPHGLELVVLKYFTDDHRHDVEII